MSISERDETCGSLKPLDPGDALPELLSVDQDVSVDEPVEPIQTTLEKIRLGIRMRVDGDSTGARAYLSSLWAAVEHGDPFARLFLAHALADVQDDPDEELRWDLVALGTHPQVTPQRAAEEGVPGGREGLLPSLHLNLAHSYARVARHNEARQQYQEALEHIGTLGDDSYGDQLRAAYAEFRAEHPDLC